MPDSTFLTRVTIHNYKSIELCKVNLGPLTFLIGRNGSGKSNFLDALQFVSDALNNSLEEAMRDRGGFMEIVNRSYKHPNFIIIGLELCLPDGRACTYEVNLGITPNGMYGLTSESCSLGGDYKTRIYFNVFRGVLESRPSLNTAFLPNQLYLRSLSGHPDFSPVFEALSNMCVYSLNTDKIRDVQLTGFGEKLERDGSNVTSVISKMRENSPEKFRRIEQYMEVVLPGLEKISVAKFSGREALVFLQKMVNLEEFSSLSMSDGTLMALGVLVALFQKNKNGVDLRLVGIEEPETGLHPRATGALYAALAEASNARQIIVTTHNSDLLDIKDVNPDSILAVSSEEGMTRIAPIDDVSRTAISDKLFTPGELLRMNQLVPADSSDFITQTFSQSASMAEAVD